MMDIHLRFFEDIKKILKQMIGREKMFGFKTTIANQLYLAYFFIGNIFFNNKVHWSVKFLWGFWTTGAMTLVAYSWTQCIIYTLTTFDVNLVIFTMYGLLTIPIFYIIIPFLAVVRYKEAIESMIQHADEMETKKSAFRDNDMFDLKIVALYFVGSYSSIIIIYMLICMFDVIVLYEEEKVKDYMYYLLPFPQVLEKGSIEFFFFINSLLFFFALSCYGVWFGLTFLLLLWVVVCHNEAIYIKYNLSLLSADDEMSTTRCYENVKSKFRSTIVQNAIGFRDLTRLIELFRSFYQAVCGLLFPTLFVIELTHAHVFMSQNQAYVVKLRELLVFFLTTFLIYVLCWVGETIKELSDTISFAVYSTPWYKSTSVRQDLYLFLCFTQKSITPTALSVYPMTLSTFLRFLNVIQSAANLLRKSTSRN